jgi:signal transduction protein with GAF and PtsI domain
VLLPVDKHDDVMSSIRSLMEILLLKKPGNMESILRSKLVIIQALVFLIPCLAVAYIAFQKKLSFNTTQFLIFVAVLTLVLGGMVILKQIFDQIFTVQTLMKKAEQGGKYLIEMQKDAGELNEITKSFNNLMRNFQEANSELQQRVFELFSIRDLTEVASKTIDIKELLTVLLEKALAVTKTQVGTVYMVDRQDHCLRLTASKGENLVPSIRTRFEFNQAPMNSILTDKKPMLISGQWLSEENFEDIDEEEYPLRYTLSMPVFVRKKMVAVLNLFPCEAKEGIESKDEHILSIMINEIGFALENAMLHSKLEKQSQNLQLHAEELTQINKRLQEAMEQKERAKKDLERANEMLKMRVIEKKSEFAKADEESLLEIKEDRH